MKSSYWLLIIALVAGLAIRGSHLSHIGYGLHPDEVLYGVEGKSIAATGCDIRHTGCPPLYLKGYSAQWDNRTSVLYPYMYSLLWRIVPATNFWLRFPSVLAGVGCILLIYLIGRQVFPNRPNASGWAAIFIAFSPIGISWSRLGHDPITMPLFTAGIVYCLLRSRASPRWLLGAASILAIGLYSYQPFKAVGLGVAVTTWLLFPPKWSIAYRRWLVIAFGVGALLVAPFAYNQVHNWTIVQGQFDSIAVWHWSSPVMRTIANTLNLILYWFLNPSLGLIFVSAFFVAALVRLRKQTRIVTWLLVWIVIAMLPALITVWTPGSNEMQSRALGLLGPVELLAGFGAAWTIEKIQSWFVPGKLGKTVAWFGVGIVVLFSIVITGLNNRLWPSWRNLTLTGMDEPLQWLQQPQYRSRAVVLNEFFFTQSYDLAWRERISPLLLQQPTGQWTEYIWGVDRSHYAQYPSQVGRFTLCFTKQCWRPHDGKLYILPLEEQPELKPLYTFHFVFFDTDAIWKIVDNQ